VRLSRWVQAFLRVRFGNSMVAHWATSTKETVMRPCRFFVMFVSLALPLILVGSGSAQTFTALASFTDGTTSVSALIQGRDGNFYGASGNGGTGYGTAFKVTPAGTLTTVYSFCSEANCADGSYPSSAPALGADGNLYGTTGRGGTGGLGTVFKVTPDGVYTVLHSFSGSDGSYPAGLVLGVDGNFYGTTFAGGSSKLCTDGCGTVFKTTASGTLSTLHSFSAEQDGLWPDAVLVQGTDGNLYGTTYAGGSEPRNYVCGAYGCGTVFKITTQGAFTVLHKFDYTDGATIYAPVAQGSDGAFYGAAFDGGFTYYEGCVDGCGTLYKVTASGKFTKLHVFAFNSGGNPYSGLAPATDGNLYGESPSGGYSTGEIFKLTPAGGFATVYSFSLEVGGGVAALVQGTDGKFYGSYYTSDIYGYSALFSLATGLSPFVAFVSPSGKVGQTAEILGQGLSGTTAVTFNGVAAATFTVVSDAYMTAVVPSGATTGAVVVTTPSGALTSNKNFRISK
jgi:uncharacterized repeat protein (TIGR03803 family)